MKKMNLFISLLLLTLILTACGNRTYQNSDVVLTDVTKETEAVVIFKVKGKSPPLSLGKGPKVSFDMARIEPATSKSPMSSVFYRIEPSLLELMNPWASQWKILMIKPGFYVIDNIYWTSGNIIYSALKDPYPTSCPVKYGAFEVQPGSVNYLGNLEFGSDRESKLSIAHTDEFSTAQDILRESHPELADRLQRTDFLPGGYHYLQPHMKAQ